MLVKAFNIVDNILYAVSIYILFTLAVIFAIAYYLMMWLVNVVTLATGRECDPSFSLMPMEGLNGNRKGR